MGKGGKVVVSPQSEADLVTAGPHKVSLVDLRALVRFIVLSTPRVCSCPFFECKLPCLFQAPEFLQVNGGFVEANGGSSNEGDMYSCAIVLWELWFKIPPFNNVVDSKVAKHLQKGRRLPMAIAGANKALVPPQLQGLIESLWVHNPAKRLTAPQALSKARGDVFPVLMEGRGVEL
jgi:hypothetical protein